MESSTPASESPARTPKLPPGPPPRKSLLDSIVYYASFYFDALGFVEERFDKYGDIYFVGSQTKTLSGADRGLYVLKHPDHLRELLSTQASKFKKEHSAFEQLSRVLGEGLLTSDGETWKRQRRLVQPAFARSRLAGYVEVMAEEAHRTFAGFSLDRAEPRDMSHEMMELTLRIVSLTLFGYDTSSDVDAVRAAMRTLQTSLATPDLLPKWAPSPTRKAVERAIADLDRVVFGLIEERRKARARGVVRPRADLLDILLDSGAEGGDASDVLTEREIRDQLMTLFLAGHETTSHALTWTLYLLSKNPHEEERLAREVRTVLGDRVPTLDDLERLPFTEQVVKEAMRLYPPAYLLARRASEDAEIGGYVIPEGSEVIGWTYMTHRDPRWFPDPLSFRPDRFAPEREAAMKPFAFLPFGAGPRACIGKAFAMVEAQILLASAIQRFRFSLVPSQKVEPSPRITLHPKNGLAMRLSPR